MKPNKSAIKKSHYKTIKETGFVPEVIHVDNGKEFDSTAEFEALGIKVIKTSPYKPTPKNTERLFRGVK